MKNLKQAEKLFFTLQTPFGHNAAMREADIQRIAAALNAAEEVGKCLRIDAEIEKILADDTPVDPNSPDVLVAELGITQGRNTMLAKALQSSIDIMNAYKRMGYGDDVYMDTLCQAIRDSERALILHRSPISDGDSSLTPASDIAALREENENFRRSLAMIANTPAWGAPDKWETTPAEVRQLARNAIAKTGSQS